MKAKLVPVLCLLIAAGVQANLPHSFYVFGVGPDLVLVVLIAFSLAADVNAGLVLGFIAGLIEGSMIGASMGSFVVTRTLVGFAAGASTATFFSVNPLVPIFSALWLTFACEVLFVLANPVPSLFDAGRTILIECLWNSLLSLILVLVMRYFKNRKKIRLANDRTWY